MFVKVAKLGSAVKELFVEDGTSLVSALTSAGVSKEGMQVRINGAVVPDSTPVKDGDVVTLIPAIKGGLL
jgi:molybdopterin converting factor small subunit